MSALALGWISYDAAATLSGVDIGGLGGIATPPSWSDYANLYGERYRPHLELLRAVIIENQLWRDGNWHQNAENGTPLWSDGTFARYSYRAWGDLMAAVWNTELGRDFNYMAFYCGVPDLEWRVPR